MLQATKAKAAGVIGAVAGLLAPGATYLLTVDGDGISGTEWLHGGLIALVAAAATGGVLAATVYRVENKPKDVV
jgi:hypothetical protein